MIEIKNLCKAFTVNGGTVDALSDVSLTINDGDIYGIIGMSGAGKSTLVRCINMLERPTEGSVLIDGADIGLMNKQELREERRKIKMIFQGFNLLEQRTCLDNIAFPLELAKVKKAERKARAMELLRLVGLEDKAKVYPSQLSGGQQQRIAIARALATDPKILLCDEATSALDPKTTRQILDLIKKINRELKITVIIITHQMSVVEDACNKVAILDGGRVVEEGEVNKVFSQPESDAAKRLVYPEIEGEDLESFVDLQRIRVVFNGALATSTPLVTRMAIDKGIIANILYASTKSIQDKLYGSMILGFTKDINLADVFSYAEAIENVYVEVLE